MTDTWRWCRYCHDPIVLADRGEWVDENGRTRPDPHRATSTRLTACTRHEPRTEVYERVPVSTLVEDDRIDLEGDRYADPDRNHPIYPYEHAVVVSTELEAEDCLVVHTDGESIGFPPNHHVYRTVRQP